MHLVSRTFWRLVGALVCLGSVVNAGGVLEIDVVFPRSNETYAPTDKFPIVFALQNAELAKHLKPSIDWFVRNNSNFGSTFGHLSHDLKDGNYSTEPYFFYSYLNIDTEGAYELFSSPFWQSCDESGDQVGIRVNTTTNFGTPFTISKGGQEVDIVAATASDQTCLAKDGVAINVTDEVREVPASNNEPARTCAVLESASPKATAYPCRVKIDTAAATSMFAVLDAALCKGLNPPANCPEENAVQQLAVAGVASFAVLFGAVGFFLHDQTTGGIF